MKRHIVTPRRILQPGFSGLESREKVDAEAR